MKTSKLEINRETQSYYYLYRSIRSWTLTRWSSGGIPEYPTAPTSMMANYHLAASLLEIKKKKGRKDTK
jgi:hypothetical protein